MDVNVAIENGFRIFIGAVLFITVKVFKNFIYNGAGAIYTGTFGIHNIKFFC
ncbi:MAG: hypothetical protein M3Z92_06215 [Bacteroidota bacterium]|nr:hypothetical protein [Bacteroidota bacterium]